MKTEGDQSENDIAEEMNKRLQKLINQKKTESEALKKILKAFDRSEKKIFQQSKTLKNKK